jgi:hypothetical protein
VYQNQHLPQVSQQVSQHSHLEEQKEEKPKSSSSSDFVFNPDPNFLANINNNIRANNQKVAVEQPILNEESPEEINNKQQT